MSERERFRLTQGLFAAAGQLSAALENEIGVLPAVFGHEREDIEESIRTGDWTNFKKRWEIWESYALDPSFVAGFHIVRASDGQRGAKLRTWDGDRFAEDSRSSLAAALDGALASREFGRSFMAPADLDDGTEAFLLSIDRAGTYWMAIRLDRKTLIEDIIPILAERYLFGKTDYLFRIVDERDGATIYASDPSAVAALQGKKDVSIPLVRSDFRVARSAEGAPPIGKPVESEPGIAIMKTRRDILEAQESPDAKSAGHLFLPPKPKIPGSARWTLEAVHKKGSLAAAVRREMLRSAAVSSGILSILGVVLVILAAAVRRTQELADRRQEFIATVTHELKTPIAVIRAAAENLADGVVKDLDKTARYGNVIRRESGKLADMIDSLLVYARVGDGTPKEKRRVDLGALAARALEYRQDELDRAGFSVATDMREGFFVKADPAALELAVGNLISNAVKHAAAGAYLRVAVRAERAGSPRAPNGWAVLEVEDRGQGIPRKERKLVFDPFYRGERARSRQTPGSGLGLNLVSRIVEAHGGEIELDTQVERGSTFIIRLPLEERENG